MEAKTVLVHVGVRVRPIKFSGTKTDLTSAIKLNFSDVLSDDSPFFIQIKDKDWGGTFVDLLPEQEVANKDQIKVIIEETNRQQSNNDSTPGPDRASVIPSQCGGCSSSEKPHKSVPACGEDFTSTVDKLVPNIDSPGFIQPSLNSSLCEQEIREMAIIYRKESSRKLSNYHNKMNAASQDLCVVNPGLLKNRVLLIENAREKIIADGFEFAKGKSRSKKGLETATTDPPPKRRRLSKETRSRRLHDIKEDYKDLNDRIKFKEKRILAYENVKDYKKCDELLEAVSELKKQRRLFEAEEKNLMRLNAQSKWYFAKKMNGTSKSSSAGSGSTSAVSDVSKSRSSTPIPVSSGSEMSYLEYSPPRHAGCSIEIQDDIVISSSETLPMPHDNDNADSESTLPIPQKSDSTVTAKPQHF